MANYPQLDNARGVWNMKEVYDAVMGGYWPLAGSRACWGGGRAPAISNVIDYVTISSAGNAADFGDLTVAREAAQSAGSFTRAIWQGGRLSPAQSDTVDYVVFSSTGNAADFGNLSSARSGVAGGVSANSKRALCAAGGVDTPANYNVIDYITMASVGNHVDFGDLTHTSRGNAKACSPTRAIFAGGLGGDDDGNLRDIIDYVEFDTLGNATDFGNLVAAQNYIAGTSSSTRAAFGGGGTDPHSNVIQYVDIASQGNAIDYGDLSVTRGFTAGASSNSVKGLWGGGATPTISNVIDSITIAVGATAVDFGDLTAARDNVDATSNAHGGLNDGYQGTRIRPIPQGFAVGQRAIVNGGKAPGYVDMVNINTLGNFSDFGTFSSRTYAGAMGGSTTRAVEFVGNRGGHSNIIEYTHFATTGNFADFGDQTITGSFRGGFSNQIRCGAMGGEAPSASNVIDYVTIASLGDAADFGDTTDAITSGQTGKCGSATRGVYIIGTAPNLDGMDYITIASAGNGTNFGDATVNKGFCGTLSSSTRGVMGGGAPGTNVIDYITIASTGDSTDFGDLSSGRYDNSGADNNVRGIFTGGGGSLLIVEYITIASTGNAADFGDPTDDHAVGSAISCGHGGLTA